jgi:hypothetical protein
LIKKSPSIKTLRNKLDAVFNAYIRERDGKCILSGSKEHLQCSHYYDKRAAPYLRWDSRNAHAMSQSIHFRHHHGRGADYALWMFQTYGMAFMENLGFDSNKKFIHTRQRLLYQNKRMALHGRVNDKKPS